MILFHLHAHTFTKNKHPSWTVERMYFLEFEWKCVHINAEESSGFVLMNSFVQNSVNAPTKKEIKPFTSTSKFVTKTVLTCPPAFHKNFLRLHALLRQVNKDEINWNTGQHNGYPHANLPRARIYWHNRQHHADYEKHHWQNPVHLRGWKQIMKTN